MEELSSLVKEEFYKGGQTLYFPGDPSDTVYFLKEGRVKLISLNANGKQLTLDIFGKGEIFGEMALIGEKQRKLEAQALERVRLCWISKDDMLNFVRKYPDLSLGVAKLMGDRWERIESKLEDLLFKDVPTRLALTLWKLARDYGKKMEQGILIEPKITHQDLADLIGSTRETTTTILNHFQDKGLIEKGWGKIMVKDQEGLKQEADI